MTRVSNINTSFGSMLTPARQVSTGTVYSLHKSATRAHVARVAAGELRAASAQVLAQLRFDLPATYAFHRRGPCRRPD